MPRTDVSQAIIFLTHLVSPKIHHHFIRLQSETSEFMDSYLCVRKPRRTRGAPRLTPDFRISRRLEKKVAPRRYEERKQRGGTVLPGFNDLAYAPALLSPQLLSYQYVWIVEYDVEFAGSWKNFFLDVMNSDADLLGTTFYPRVQCPDWIHWTWFETPPEVSRACHVRSFLPIVRFSRSMINCYRDALTDGRWRGHSEALFPTVACFHGLKIEDIGGNGPFTPVPLCGRIYRNAHQDPDLVPGTFVYRPAKPAYFPDAPDEYEAGFCTTL